MHVHERCQNAVVQKSTLEQRTQEATPLQGARVVVVATMFEICKRSDVAGTGTGGGDKLIIIKQLATIHGAS